jgi:hypothetical protein
MVPAEDTERPADAQSKAALLRRLGELGLRSVVLDANPGATVEAIAELTHEFVVILESSIELLGQLERVASASLQDKYDFPELAETTWIGTRRSARPAARLDDICFAGTLELNRARRALAQANGDNERLVAVETARRKLHRAVHAALINGGELSPAEHVAASALKQRFVVELESALVVRRLFANFRRSLRRAENGSVEAVLMALRYAAGALAALTTSARYGALRLPDRLLLGQQRERLLDWSRSGRPVPAGLQLLEDIWISAEMLRDINRRQELRAHDEQLIRDLLSPTAHGQNDWLPRLDRLSGLDDGLDALLARAATTDGSTVLLDLTLRLACLV